MLIRHRPAAPLDAAIECLWLSRRSENSPDCEHMLPSGKAQLVITLHDSPIEWAHANSSGSWQSWTRGVVHGPQTRYYLAGPKPKGTVVGVSFRPGMAAALLGASMQEFQDSHVSLEQLWGYRGIDIHERLASVSDPSRIFRLLEGEMIARLRWPLLIHPAIAYALQAHIEPRRVEDVRQRSGYSPRHFIELFRSTVGLAPKHYYRVRRFSNALTRIARGNVRLADVAAAAGYSDQAHLSREFRELAGVTPSAYQPRGMDSEHHHVVAGHR